MDYTELFHLLKGLIPKMQMQDLGFTWQQIIADREAFHGVENALDISCGDKIREISRFIAAFFDQM